VPDLLDFFNSRRSLQTFLGTLYNLQMSARNDEVIGINCGVSANEYSCAHHVTWIPNKLWRYTFIFNLWFILWISVPGGSAEWLDVGLLQPHPRPSQLLQIRTHDIRIVPGHVVVTEVVCHHQDDVRLQSGSGTWFGFF
jgi:hypothetical protein